MGGVWEGLFRVGGVWVWPDHQLDDVIETHIIVKERETILQLSECEREVGIIIVVHVYLNECPH